MITIDFRKEENECGNSGSKTWWWTCLFLCVAASVVLLKLIMSYAASYLTLAPIEVTDKQRSLLAIGESGLFRDFIDFLSLILLLFDKVIFLTSGSSHYYPIQK